MKYKVSAYLPLSPATLHILLALAGEDLHGYGIMQEVLRQSEGRYKLGPGTLYDNIQRLTTQGLVQEVARRSADRAGHDDPRRRYYRLNSEGRSVLSAEISRLETVVRDGKLRMQSAKPRRAG
jgi:DNA-binding PadR family transcriptional regulator